MKVVKHIIRNFLHKRNQLMVASFLEMASLTLRTVNKMTAINMMIWIINIPESFAHFFVESPYLISIIIFSREKLNDAHIIRSLIGQMPNQVLIVLQQLVTTCFVEVITSNTNSYELILSYCRQHALQILGLPSPKSINGYRYRLCVKILLLVFESTAHVAIAHEQNTISELQIRH